MNIAFGLILLLLLLSGIGFAYLGPKDPRTDFRYLEYNHEALISDQEWKSYTFKEPAFDIVEISNDKIERRESELRWQIIRHQADLDRGITVGRRFQAEFTRFSNRNQVH